VAKWEEFEQPGFAVWCDKTLVLGGLLALSGQHISGSALVDAIALIDAVVWFDHVVVDASLKAEWPAQLTGVFIPRSLEPDELVQLGAALEATWDQRNVDRICQDFWRRLFDDPAFKMDLWQADLAVGSARDSAELMEQADSLDLRMYWDEEPLPPGRKSWRPKQQIAAFHTARAFSGGLISAQLGLFHMPSAIRRGLLAAFNTPCRATELITIEPVAGARLPSAFGRVAEIEAARGCGLWDAVATVRKELEPVRKSLRAMVTDPGRIRAGLVRRHLGFGQPELQVSAGLNFAVVSGSFGRTVQSRQVAVVQRLTEAADTLAEAADDLCRLTRLEVPVISGALHELTTVARRLAR
jgi:hypothetical protein